MHLPRLSVAILGLSSALLLFACGDSSPEGPAASLPSLVDGPIQAEQARIVLDRVNFGESRKGRFHLKNHSDEVQRILRVGPANCSCTSMRMYFPDRADRSAIDLTGRAQEIEINPGEEFEIEVTFDSSRMRRPVSRKIDLFAVMIEGARGLPLEYAIDVWVPFWVEPWSVAFDRVGVREQATAFATVKAKDVEANFDLLIPETVDGWSIKVRRIEEGSADFAIEFQAPPELPQGPFDVRIPITTNLPDSPSLTVALQGIAVPDLDWSPQRVTLAPDANGRAQAKVVLTSRAAQRPLSLRAVIVEGLPAEFANRALKTSSAVLKAEQSYAIEMLLSEPPSERLEGTLILVTDDPDQPRIEIPLVLRPRG